MNADTVSYPEDGPEERQPAARPEYAGLVIRKRTLSISAGGQAEVPPEVLVAEPRSTVRLDVLATLSSTKHKFVDGGVEEMLVLVIDPDSVMVLEVKPPAPRPQDQPTLDEALATGSGLLTADPETGEITSEESAE